MRKMLKTVVAVAMCLFMLGPVITAKADFTPSVSSKPAPEIVTKPDGNGKEIVGHVRDENGNILSTEYSGCIIVTPISKVDTSTEIPKEAATLLKKVYNDIVMDKTVFSKYSSLNQLVKEALGEGKDGDDLVVRDIFDVTAVSNGILTNLPPAGHTMDVTFDLDIGPNTFVAVMAYLDGEWRLIPDVINNGDGTVTCIFDEFCPVMFLTPGTGVKGTLAPVTGDTVMKDITLWIVLAGASLVAMIGVLVVYRRKRY